MVRLLIALLILLVPGGLALGALWIAARRLRAWGATADTKEPEHETLDQRLARMPVNEETQRTLDDLFKDWNQKK